MTTRLLYLLLFIPTLAFGQIRYHRTNGFVWTGGPMYGDGSGLTNLPTSSGTGSSNITDSAYYAVARNLTVNTNADINNLTVTNLTVDSGSGIGSIDLENSGTNIISLNGTNGTVTSVTNVSQYGVFGYTEFSTNATIAGPFLSTSPSITAPASSELATAGWVRGLFDGFGVSYYVTTNINNTFTNADLVTTNTAVFEFNTSIPVYDRRTYKVPTNNCYMGQVTTTNRFQQLLAGVVVNSYLEAQNGSGTGGPQVKPEIYISYDKTNWLGDWDAQPQYIPEGATNLISWVVANPTYVSTNAAGFYVQRRFKMVAQTSPNASDVILHLGTNRPSHIALNGDVGTSGNAYLAANQVFTGSNYFTQPIQGPIPGSNIVGSINAILVGTITNEINSAGNIAASGTFTGNGGGLTNLVNAQFGDFTNYGTNIVLSATNGNLQSWAITNASWVTLDSNTNYTETIRLNVYGSNTVVWTTSNLSNSASLGPTNSISVMLFDHARGTNLWWGYRLR